MGERKKLQRRTPLNPITPAIAKARLSIFSAKASNNKISTPKITTAISKLRGGIIGYFETK